MIKKNNHQKSRTKSPLLPVAILLIGFALAYFGTNYIQSKQGKAGYAAVELESRGKYGCDSKPNLSKGDSGKCVKRLQSRLRHHGYTGVKVTGNFNDKTKSAVKKFQRRKNLDVTGRVNKKTWNKLLNN